MPGCFRLAVLPIVLPALAACLAATPLHAQAPPAEKKVEIYDPKADAAADIARALDRGRSDHRRVLLVYGGNWCGWCVKLHDLFKSDAEIAGILRSEYLVVPVDIGSFNKQTDLAGKYGADLKKHGVPFLTVLDSDGKPLVNQNTSDLEEGKQHDRVKVKAFLEKWKPEPADAEAFLKVNLARARAGGKHVLLHLSGPG